MLGGALLQEIHGISSRGRWQIPIAGIGLIEGLAITTRVVRSTI